MPNNWMLEREPVKTYLPLLSLDPVARQDGIRSQACRLLFAERGVPSAQERPVSFTEKACFASGLQYLLDCHLWWLKVQIGLVDEGIPPTHSALLQCHSDAQTLSFFLPLDVLEKLHFDFFPHTTYKTKCQTFFKKNI